MADEVELRINFVGGQPPGGGGTPTPGPAAPTSGSGVGRPRGTITPEEYREMMVAGSTAGRRGERALRRQATARALEQEWLERDVGREAEREASDQSEDARRARQLFTSGLHKDRERLESRDAAEAVRRDRALRRQATARHIQHERRQKSEAAERRRREQGRQRLIQRGLRGVTGFTRYGRHYRPSLTQQAFGVRNLAAAGAGGLAAGGAVALLGNAALQAAKQIGTMTAEFVRRGRELAGYSPALAGAEARADIRAQRADIREANVLGDNLAKLTDAYSRLETYLRDGLLPIKEFVVKVLANFIEFFADALKKVLDFLRIRTDDADDTLERIWRDFFDASIPTFNRPPDVLERRASERLRVPAFLGR